MESVIQRRLREEWMRAGVTFVLPETTYLHADLELGQDVVVGPHCVLTRATRIASGTILEAGCVLEACEIGSDCRLLHVRGQLARLASGVSVGPYVNLRPGTDLAEGVKVGNFVEIKNAVVGRGSKLPHLSYVGDAEIGQNVNIGAGTIFCNYDGVNKQVTRIGNDVFIGSNSSLQAPLEIGDGAYVGMASAITRDVPADALAIGRARQENKPGRARLLREQQARRKAAGDPNQTREGGAK
jgi:bifunctional UDP-N-acetylglucosamine pyrophosphorylase/glucosamine-1-phosphate N-acetyltransferase